MKSCLDGLPVRVVRGRNPDSVHAPAAGFRYDGVYFVEDYWQDRGKSGFLIWRYRLVSRARREPAELEEPGPARKVRATVQRLVRSTAVVLQVKALYGNTCQVCQVPIAVPTGRYAEGAHIRRLGHPHDGPDVLGNVLCLCPNDHVRFDYGAILGMTA